MTSLRRARSPARTYREAETRRRRQGHRRWRGRGGFPATFFFLHLPTVSRDQHPKAPIPDPRKRPLKPPCDPMRVSPPAPMQAVRRGARSSRTVASGFACKTAVDGTGATPVVGRPSRVSEIGPLSGTVWRTNARHRRSVNHPAVVIRRAASLTG